MSGVRRAELAIVVPWLLFGACRHEVRARGADATTLVAPPPAREADATTKLAEVLSKVFVKERGDEQAWAHRDVDAFWKQIQGLIEAGADAEAASRRSVNIWRAVFVPDPRCQCAPYGWPDGYDTNKCPNPKYTPDCLDRERGSFETRTAFLLARNVDPNLAAPGDRPDGIPTPLCAAVSLGTTRTVNMLLEHKASCTKPCPESSLVQLAAQRTDPEQLCAILRCGAPVDAPNPEGDTALFYPALLGLAKNVSILLDHGVDPAVKNEKGEVALDWARRKHKSDVVRLLTRWRTQGMRPTHSMCALGAGGKPTGREDGKSGL